MHNLQLTLTPYSNTLQLTLLVPATASLKPTDARVQHLPPTCSHYSTEPLPIKFTIPRCCCLGFYQTVLWHMATCERLKLALYKFAESSRRSARRRPRAHASLLSACGHSLTTTCETLGRMARAARAPLPGCGLNSVPEGLDWVGRGAQRWGPRASEWGLLAKAAAPRPGPAVFTPDRCQRPGTNCPQS